MEYYLSVRKNYTHRYWLGEMFMIYCEMMKSFKVIFIVCSYICKEQVICIYKCVYFKEWSITDLYINIWLYILIKG